MGVALVLVVYAAPAVWRCSAGRRRSGLWPASLSRAHRVQLPRRQRRRRRPCGNAHVYMRILLSTTALKGPRLSTHTMSSAFLISHVTSLLMQVQLHNRFPLAPRPLSVGDEANILGTLEVKPCQLNSRLRTAPQFKAPRFFKPATRRAFFAAAAHRFESRGVA